MRGDKLKLSLVQIRDDHENCSSHDEPKPAQLAIVAIGPSGKPEGKQTAQNTNGQEVDHRFVPRRPPYYLSGTAESTHKVVRSQ